jgi:hypothetical protein
MKALLAVAPLITVISVTHAGPLPTFSTAEVDAAATAAYYDAMCQPVNADVKNVYIIIRTIVGLGEWMRAISQTKAEADRLGLPVYCERLKSLSQ